MSTPAPRGPGRPRALDDIKRGQVCALISAGCGVEGAARYVGCAASTIRREALRDADFSAQLRRAHLDCELSLVVSMREFAKRYWRACAWLLERMNPERYGRNKALAITPAQLKTFTELCHEVIQSEMQHDPAAVERLGARLRELSVVSHANIIAGTVDPAPDQALQSNNNTQLTPNDQQPLTNT
jgi:hypothetical protein